MVVEIAVLVVVVKAVNRLKVVFSFYGNPVAKLQSITCHMRSHGVT